jgi:hypothetical protein
MTIDQLIPAITPLSQADKIRLLQVVAQQLTRETTASRHAEPAHAPNPLKGSVTFEKNTLSPIGAEEETSEAPVRVNEPFDPKRFYGAAHHSRQDIDQYLLSARDGWNE